MKRGLLVLILWCVASSVSAQVVQNGQVINNGPRPCSVAHGDAVVNTLVTVSTPTPRGGQAVFVCGIDLTVSNDSTGAVTQVNVQFTSANLGGWKYTYSSINAANTNGLDKIFYPNLPLRASIEGVPVSIASPAINLHAAYSINLYYYIAPAIP